MTNKKSSSPKKTVKKSVSKKQSVKKVVKKTTKVEKTSTDKIFVQIASYRDPQLLPTLRDMFKNAKHPENIVVALCWQHDEKESLEEFANDVRFKIIDIPYKQAKGVCWARSKLNELYNDEEYTMQLDSHHRFAENWDETLISMINGLIKKGHKKPVLSAYIPSYEPADPLPDEGKIREPWKLNFDRFLPEGPVVFRPATIDNWREIDSPVPARFMSGHFIFTSGQFIKDIPYDPDLYFYGEEISLAVRAFTSGYDLFHPHRCVVWHQYTRKGALRHWDDDKNWNKLNSSAYEKVTALLGVDGKRIEFDQYGLGKERTLEDYEKYSGIRFKDRAVQKYTLDFNLAPNPKYKTKKEYENSFLRVFKHCLDIYEGDLPEKDYDLLVVEFKDDDGNSIRCDLGEEETKKTLASSLEDQFYRIWRTAYIDFVPESFVFWPRSKSKGWMKRTETRLPRSKIKYSSSPDSLWDKFDESKSFTSKGNRTKNKRKIFLHIPAYREPELIPTIESAIKNAKYSNRLVFGICRQYNPDDKFDDLSKYEKDKRFKIINMLYTEAKGLPFARYQCNTMITDEDYVLQLDSHHRFAENWDETLIDMHDGLKSKGHKKPIIGGYLPFYQPENDPAGRVKIPFQSVASCFYPHGTLFIRPGAFAPGVDLSEPPAARFLSGHFSFADAHWAKTIKHDVDIYFSGEEINLTVRSFTHGYDLFHLNKTVIWHAMERKERNGILVWDDQWKRGDTTWTTEQDKARAKIRQLLRTEYNGFDLTGYDLGTERTIEDYEKYSGFNFKEKTFNNEAVQNVIPDLNRVSSEQNKLKKSFYHLVTITKNELPNNDYSKILVAYDNEKGIGIHTRYIEGDELTQFTSGKANIHYEDYMFLEEWPKRVVYWGFSDSRGWAERVEHLL